MSENMKLLLKWMKQYIDEPNVPDYSGEYPPCWEITQEDVKEILEYINSLQQENKQLKEDCEDLFNQKEIMFKNMQLNQLKCCDLAKQLKQGDKVIDKAIRMLEINIEIIKEQPSDNKLEDDFNIGRYEDLLEILNKYKGDSK